MNPSEPSPERRSLIEKNRELIVAKLRDLLAETQWHENESGELLEETTSIDLVRKDGSIQAYTLHIYSQIYPEVRFSRVVASLKIDVSTPKVLSQPIQRDKDQSDQIGYRQGQIVLSNGEPYTLIGEVSDVDVLPDHERMGIGSSVSTVYEELKIKTAKRIKAVLAYEVSLLISHESDVTIDQDQGWTDTVFSKLGYTQDTLGKKNKLGRFPLIKKEAL